LACTVWLRLMFRVTGLRLQVSVAVAFPVILSMVARMKRLGDAFFLANFSA